MYTRLQGIKMKNTKETFVAKATSLFGNKYDYTEFEFIDMQTKGLVKCNICSNQCMVFFSL